MTAMHISCASIVIPSTSAVSNNIENIHFSIKLFLWNILLTPPTRTQREGVWPVTSQIIRISRKTVVQNDQLQGFLGLFKGRVCTQKVKSHFEFLILPQRKSLRSNTNHNTSTIHPQERRHSQCSRTEKSHHMVAEQVKWRRVFFLQLEITSEV